MRTQIVLLSGKQGSGKTTLTKALESDVKCSRVAFHELRFAGCIYSIHDFAREYLRSIGIERPDKDGKLLQLLGTEWGRQTIADDVWIRAAQGMVKKIQRESEAARFQRLVIVISDARFVNEFEAFPEALRVRLECARDVRKARCDAWRDTEGHSSEIDLDNFVLRGRFDMIFNTQTQTTLHCSTMIQAQLDKDVWLDKREHEGDY